MLSLCTDLYLIIGTHLNNEEKVRLTIISKKLSELRHIFTYFDKICFDKIEKLPYFNNFVYVIISGENQHKLLPSKCKYVHAVVSQRDSFLEMMIHNNAIIKHVTINCDEYITLPSSVTHLTITGPHGYSAYPLDSFMNVTHVEFGDKFDARIDVFSNDKIRYLKFGKVFNAQTDFNKFKNLTHLILGDSFTHDLCGKIPESVTHLTFGANYEHCVSFLQRTKITHLVFGEYYNQPISWPDLPASLTHLTFGRWFNTNVYTTVVYCPINIGSYQSPGVTKRICFIPPLVTHLIFGRYFNLPLDTIPSSITHLTVYYNFKYIDTIPSSVTYLTIKNDNI